MRQRQMAIDAPVVLLLTIEQAAQALNIGRSLMYELVLKNKIPSIKVNRYRRISIDALNAYVKQQTQQGAY
ncbi:MAG: excisionase family DNA-binding protein [Ktedonobacterales bacterium]|nr:excisionase family DNA-binding protein [Ktedonobacterales bacterium]